MFTDGRRTEGPPNWKSSKDRDHWIARPAHGQAELKCQAHGYPKPTITWYRNGVPIIDDRDSDKYRIRRWNLRIHDLTLQDSGNYTCKLFNRYGKLDWVYYLEVIDARLSKPSVTLENTTATFGETVVFECKTQSDTPPFFQWVKHYQVNGSYLSQDGTPFINVVKKSAVNVTDPQFLRLVNVSKDDEGWYTCMASFAAGRVFASAWLTVKESKTVEPYQDTREEGAPKLADTNIFTFENARINLRCKVIGNPKPLKKWYKDGVLLSRKQNKRYIFLKNALIIERATTKDSGIFTCYAWNNKGSLTRNFTVRVQNLFNQRPWIPRVTKMLNKTALIGETVKLVCQIEHGDLKPRVKWVKHYQVNGSYTDPNHLPYFKVIQGSKLEVSNPEILLLENVTKEEAGWYSCLVSSSAGRTHTSTWLAVVDALP